MKGKIRPVNPSESVDTVGVGRLMKIAVDESGKARHDTEIGICGEHGGDPASIKFCHKLGLNYVSCLPHRVLVARWLRRKPLWRPKKETANGPWARRLNVVSKRGVEPRYTLSDSQLRPMPWVIGLIDCVFAVSDD